MRGEYEWQCILYWRVLSNALSDREGESNDLKSRKVIKKVRVSEGNG